VITLALWYLKTTFYNKFQVLETRFFVDFYIDAGPDWIPLDVRYLEGIISNKSIYRYFGISKIPKNNFIQTN
jgi:hypothetical protein